MKITKLLIGLFAVAVLVMSGTACSQQEQENNKLKVGFITVGPKNDWGYNYSHVKSMEDLQKALGDRIETTLVEKVPETEDVERVMERLIADDYKLLFPTSFGYLDATLRVAKKHPDVIFMHCGGYKNAPNVGTYFAYLDEPFYLAGVVAGHATKTNKLGFVAAHPIPNIVREINAFTLGARRVNPDVQVNVVWTNTWSDPAKEAEAANSLLDGGADVLTAHQDSPIAVVQTAEKRGAYSVGVHADLSKFAPKGWLTGAEWHWEKIVIKVTKEVLDGTWKNTMIRGGLAEGYVGLSPFGPSVPEPVRTEVEHLKDQIVSGNLHVFQGPLKDRTGELRIAEGATADFKVLEEMNWFVDGVKGALPSE